MVRIQKYLSDCGVGSRRQAEKMVEEGRVRVNGELAGFGAMVRPGEDQVLLDGVPVEPEDRVYVLFNKPRGVLSAPTDPDDRTTFQQYLQGLDRRVFPVGRLPREVEGALLLTNDGELYQALSQPNSQVEKIYLASVEGLMTESTVRKLSEGVRFGGGPPARAKAMVLNEGLRTSLVRISLRESRQCRVGRLLAAVGHPAYELKRIAIGNLHLQDLAPGQWRLLSEREIETFRRQIER